jgi:cyclic pyranopterin phosphate synthase
MLITQPLLDRFGRRHSYLRISLTDRCNFRCRYCMPAEGLPWLPKQEILTFEEIERLTRLFARLGVGKVRLTGGEPTVRKDLESLIRQMACIDGVQTLAMTTNGSTLETTASVYRAAGLNDLTVSLDSLSHERFREITLRDELGRVLRGIDAALAARFNPVKINVVVMKGVNDDELLDFVELTRNKAVNVRFIEFMPFAGNAWHQAKLLPFGDMRQVIESRYRLDPQNRAPSAVAKDFKIEGMMGSVSFVASMTDSFCGDCNRLRLTAEGALKVCLFSNREVSLRDPMRDGADDAELEAIIREALLSKWKEHPDLATLSQVPNRAMVSIGG